MEPRSRSGASSTASGPVSDPAQMGLGPGTWRRRSCNVTASVSTISMPGKSTRPFAAQVIGCIEA